MDIKVFANDWTASRVLIPEFYVPDYLDIYMAHQVYSTLNRVKENSFADTILKMVSAGF